MNAAKRLSVGLAGLNEGQSTTVLAHPSKAGARVECVGPVVRV